MEETLNIIKDSFELWYNRNVTQDNPVSIVINYSDVQKLHLKAFHTVTIDMQAIGTLNDLATITKLMTISENYNHGTTSEQEAKDNLTKKFLEQLYSFKP